MTEAEVRRERAAKLSVVIEEYLRAPEMEFKADGMLGDWVLIGTNSFVDEDGDPNAQYFVAMSNGSQLQHITIGLLHKALEMCSTGSPTEE